MRILHVFKTYLPESIGGIEQVIYQLCQSTEVHGVESEVLTLSPDPHPAQLRVGNHLVHRVKLDLQLASTGFSFGAPARLKQLAAQADIVHYHFPWPFMDLLHLVADIDKPYVVSYHSDIVRQKYLLALYRPLMSRFLGKAGKIVAASPNYLETSEVLQRYRDKVEVIPYGLDKATFPEPDPQRLQHWTERCGPRFFLFVGVMRYYKGLHVLLEAIAGTGYPLVIAGTGPMKRELLRQAERLGLKDIHFAGRIDEEDKAALLQLCTAFVFPSHLRSESFGVSLLEAAMYGKPLISCEIGSGTSYINLHGETGLVVPPSDPKALREAMRTIWEDPESAAVMGQRAAERYQALFTADRMGGQMAELYRSLLQGR
ncbi:MULTISPECIES: glycosyltransferase family 4 protein [unclassified Pseudomonas]|uniref:glycosyltransferase family 4 protein n=1 Tax=unclassified Pseudomonas TaxID=196821 RepID=UPI002446C51C|nr:MULTISPECIES: glycosyltransferase family 4 protein [unclassified Pseudomonas]MDH0896237.1 glycosyltransferase family 4 protein [Pseudomonas sp. GD03875]MDH1064973.1 glycosyltransferase family 4 protein [Pseudomonas sp. GD03985]